LPFSRRNFLKSLCRTAVVLPFADVLSLAMTNPFQAPAHTPAKTSSAADLGVSFIDVAHDAGLNAKTIFGGEHKNKYLLETTGCGVAFYDYDNDGWLDIFLVNGTRLEGFPAGSEPVNHLFKNNRDGTFTDVTDKAGLRHSGWGQGVCVGDYDNDGNDDLFITYFGKNVLYHNNGNGTFSDVTAKAGVEGGGWSVSTGFLDYDNDGKLDLFVTRYLNWTTARSKACGGSMRDYCPPGEFPAVSNLLYHNRGDGTFDDVSVSSGIAARKGHGLGVAFADYDGDGFTDIFVANDVVEHFLFHNNGNGTFSDAGVESGAALTGDGKMMSGMGVVFQDYDNDGRPDLIVTELPPQIYCVFHNEGGGVFTDQSLESGFGVLSGAVSGWGIGLEDFDNDGWKDVLIPQGHVIDTVEEYTSSFHYREPPLLAMNRKGHFERADAGSSLPVAGRGAAYGDLNNDGKVDVVTTALGGPPQVFMNHAGGAQHWLTISLRGTKSNRDGFGARVQVDGQVRIATSTASYLSSNDKRLHFGLSSAESVNVEVLWPSGIRQTLQGVRTDQFLEVQEPTHP